MTATATSFPLSKHTGGDVATSTFSGWCVYLQLTWEVDLPPSPVEFSSHHHFYKLSHSWLLGRCHRYCLLRTSLFIYSSVRDCPSPPLALRAPHPLCYVSFLLLLFIISLFFSFFPGWSVCPGGLC
jgi:hypothetical protein